MCNPVDPSKGLFQLLPKEIAIDILYRIEIKDWKTCARVSKYFKGLTEDKTIFEKHPRYSSYMHDVAAKKISDLLWQDEKFLSPLKRTNGTTFYSKAVVEGYIWCYLLTEGKKSLNDTELETLKAELLSPR